MAKTKRPSFRINDRVTLASHVRAISAYEGKPFVGRETVLRVASVTGTGSLRNPWMVRVTDDAGHFWTLQPTDFTPAEQGRAHMDKKAFRVEQEMENASGPTGMWKTYGTFDTREEAVKNVKWLKSHGGNARLASSTSHMAKKTKTKTPTDAELDRDLEAVIQAPRDGWEQARTRKGWPETWDKLVNGWWLTLEKQPGGGWALGTSRRRGDSDYIDRGVSYPTWEAAAKFAKEWARG